ncbi:MAG TPA: multicopper oxidase domain-containing protein [Bryocella sp.]|nr:multicopper oxidase domain-containing protein [Bryocella sp.]
MRTIVKLTMELGILAMAVANAYAQAPVCPPRPQPGTLIQNPLDLYSENGVLRVNMTLENSFGSDQFEHYCYVYMYQGQPVEAPTLRLNPGDELELNLTNDIQAPYGPYSKREHARMQVPMFQPPPPGVQPPNDCTGGQILPGTTNMHFHGLNVPPICHQDDVIYTLIQPGDPPWDYDIQIPANDNPGMYWYHPHAHGNATTQVDGGAAGAIFLEGTINGTQGLPERVFVIRQQFKNPNSWLPGPNQLTVNFQPAIFPNAPSPYINMQYGQSEFWRIVNASTQAFLTLQLQYTSGVQQLEVVAIDGIPLTQPIYETQITLSPAQRVEFIVPGLPENQEGMFQTNGYITGPTGNPNPPQQLFKIFGTSDPKQKVHPALPPTKPPAERQRFAGLANLTPTMTRNLYFSEQFGGSNGPSSFFITVQGHKPRVFHMDDPPAIVTKVGAVEDWTIENHAGEAHDFHIHQIHFLLMAINGVPVQNPELYDTFPIPAWSGSGPYPSITGRFDFRDPNIAGTFVYHCHILDHEDGGMMQKIQVNP